MNFGNHNFRSWVAPKVDKETDREIDMLNINCIFYASLFEGIIQLVSLILYYINKRGAFDEMSTIIPFVNVSFSVLLCFLGFIVSRLFRSREEIFTTHPKAVKLFYTTFVVMMIFWGMVASLYAYLKYQQILTFYTVGLLVVLFFRLKPYVTAAVILSTSVLYYILLESLIPGLLHPYNYFMMAILAVAGAGLNYTLTVRYIEQKNKATRLNESLEIIANHDSMTRLQNRYALNQNVAGYAGEDICLAISDINDFKKVNDTYGHLVGDAVLKAFATILIGHFPKEDVYRYGGDEFLIITRTDDLEGFNQKLRLMNEEFSRVVLSDGHTGFSSGFGSLSAHPETSKEVMDLIFHADLKLYEDKQKKKALQNKGVTTQNTAQRYRNKNSKKR